MAFFERTVRELNDTFRLGGRSGALVMEFLRTVTSEKSGSLGGFLVRLRTAGLGDTVDSWIGQGENEPITAARLESALGSDFISRMASKVGMAPSAVAPALAFLAPKVIDKLTPNGQVATSLPPDVSALLTGVAATTASRSSAEASGKSPWRRLRALLGLFGERRES